MAKQKRTTIVIAHRLSTIRDASKIAVVDKGAVVEEGTHDELLDLCGAYASLVKAQQSQHDERAAPHDPRPHSLTRTTPDAPGARVYQFPPLSYQKASAPCSSACSTLTLERCARAAGVLFCC
eukprot:1046604-Prymnesium_polylepis.1